MWRTGKLPMVFLSILVLFGHCAGPGLAEELEPGSMIIGTGSAEGVYHPTGGAICRLLNRDYLEHGIRCLIDSTEGSVYNLKKIRSGELQMGFAQSDWQYHAYNGSDIFTDQGPDQNLRTVFSVHHEPFTVVARADSGIKTFDDLKGKRVNIGNPGSGQRATMEVFMQLKGWSNDVFAEVFELEAKNQARALCDDHVDAIIYTVGHPNSSILEATTACDSLLIAVEGETVEKLIANHPYYSRATIAGGMYRGNPEPVATFGVTATLLTSASLDDEIVYQTVKTVFENFERFRAALPALANLEKASMITNGINAPLHPGAVRYYREAGLME